MINLGFPLSVANRCDLFSMRWEVKARSVTCRTQYHLSEESMVTAAVYKHINFYFNQGAVLDPLMYLRSRRALFAEYLQVWSDVF